MDHTAQLPAADALHHVYHQIAELKETLERLGLGQGAALPTAPPPAPAAAPLALPLSDRHRQFLKLLCDRRGYTYKEMAHRMHCHTSTLRTYRERIAKYYGIRGKTNLLRWALENGLG